MTNDDTRQALDRVERALARIEAVEQSATARLEPVAPGSALAERHDRLRDRVQETIERLDLLIGESAG